MAEPITEMYCENCGQRHVFGGQKPGGVARIRRVSRGLRSYVLNEAPTIGDAMADAWTRLEAEGTVRQIADLGATFSLCLECRRYVCHDCWNPAESLCRTCAPTAEDRLAAAASEPQEIVDRRPDESRVEVLEAPAPEDVAAVEIEAVAAVEIEVAPEVVAVVDEPVAGVAVVAAVEAAPPASPQDIDSDVLAAARAAGFPVDVDQAGPVGRAAIAPPAAHPVEAAPGPQRVPPAASAAPPDAAPAALAGTPATPTLGAVTRASPEMRPSDVAPRPGNRHRRRPVVATRTIPSPIRCSACGLHLPAAARFCRRCGVRQGVEA